MEFREFFRILRHNWVVALSVMIAVQLMYIPFGRFQKLPPSFSMNADVIISVKREFWEFGNSPSATAGQPDVLDRSTILASLNAERFHTLIREQLTQKYPTLSEAEYKFRFRSGSTVNENYKDGDSTVILRVDVSSSTEEVCAPAIEVFLQSFEDYASELAKKNLIKTEENLEEAMRIRRKDFEKALQQHDKDSANLMQPHSVEIRLEDSRSRFQSASAQWNELKSEKRLLLLEIEKGSKGLASFDDLPVSVNSTDLSLNIQRVEKLLEIALRSQTEESMVVMQLEKERELLSSQMEHVAEYSQIAARKALHVQLQKKKDRIDLIDHLLALTDIDVKEALQERNYITGLKEKSEAYFRVFKLLDGLKLAKSSDHRYVTLISKGKVSQSLTSRTTYRIFNFLLVGAILGGMAAYFVHLTSTAVHTEHDVRKYINLPILLRVPRFPAKESPLLRDRDKHSATYEMFKAFCQTLSVSYLESGKNLVQFTSPESLEGKTTISINSAFGMSALGQKVLLIDCDLRKPTMHSVLGLKDRGLGECLDAMLLEDSGDGKTPASDTPAQLQEHMQRCHEGHFDVLVAGSSSRDSAILFRSKAFKKMLETCRSEYDVVILDSPPVAMTSDSVMVAAHADFVVLVMAINETDKYVSQRSKHMLELAGVVLSGVVMNKCSRDMFQARYYYGYSGYGYGSKREPKS